MYSEGQPLISILLLSEGNEVNNEDNLRQSMGYELRKSLYFAQYFFDLNTNMEESSSQ
jgi:hypothetical protein